MRTGKCTKGEFLWLWLCFSCYLASHTRPALCSTYINFPLFGAAFHKEGLRFCPLVLRAIPHMPRHAESDSQSLRTISAGSFSLLPGTNLRAIQGRAKRSSRQRHISCSATRKVPLLLPTLHKKQHELEGFSRLLAGRQCMP